MFWMFSCIWIFYFVLGFYINIAILKEELYMIEYRVFRKAAEMIIKKLYVDRDWETK